MRESTRLQNVIDDGRDEPAGGEQNRGSIWSLASLATLSMAGFGFWVLAAVRFDDASVGTAAAWFTLIQLVGLLAGLGVPILINRTGGQTTAPAIAGSGALFIGVAAGLLGVVAPFAAGAEWRSLSGLSGLSLSPLLVVASVGMALGAAVDARFMSLRRWPLVFVRALLPSIARLSLLAFDPLSDRAAWLVLASVVPLALSGYAGLVFLLTDRNVVLQSPRRLEPDDKRFLAVQHFSAVATYAPFHIIPLLVARQVSGPTNAAFYLVWVIGVTVAAVPQVLSQVLLSEASLSDAGRRVRVRRTLAANLSFAVVVWLASFVAAGPVLKILGSTYGDIAGIVPWILLSSVAWAVTTVCLTEARLARNGAATAWISGTLAVSSVLLSLVLIPVAAEWGAVFAWLIANVIGVVVGLWHTGRRIGMP